MNCRWIIAILILYASTNVIAQNTTDNMQKTDHLPYYQIPDAPESYTAHNVIARMIDGLGFRYYWATEGLRAEDLAYKPSENARTAAETIDHIYGLCQVIANAAKNEPNIRPSEGPGLNFEEKRAYTLRLLKEASDIFKHNQDLDISLLKVKFKNGEQTSEYPYWNLINGPLADAVWHVGQVVSFRRASGNPFNSKVSVFNGKLRE